MVWGCFSYEGVGRLAFIDGIMDAVQYKRILAENLSASCDMLGLADDYTFQHDNDPKYTADYVDDFFTTNCINVLEWPSQSPYLNPIEHLWDYIKWQVRKAKPSGEGQMKKLVAELWYNTPNRYAKNQWTQCQKESKTWSGLKGSIHDFK
ncbi:hypothetical protein ENBRE01_2817 [Enteropsectra breve]|nr:hypothetical protein ENBRE01_2817 [Enteropsectra breve]